MFRHDNGWGYFALLLFSGIVGIYLFFLNPLLANAFDLSQDNIEWYAIFSQNIVHPTTDYIAESILLPLLAKVIGASASTQSYRILCALLTISLLPFLAIVTTNYFNSTGKAFLFILIFGATFTYLSNYRLGFPDPLTIGFLSFTALQRQPNRLYFGSLLAGLSHFSMSVFALSALSLLIACSSTANTKNRIESIKFIALGLISSRILLALWFSAFEYKLTSRFDFVLDNGLNFFINHHGHSLREFWFIPGILFLTSYFVITGYFFIQRKILFAFAFLIAISLAYVAHFLAVDGLRVFAVVITSSYTLMLASFIDSFSPKTENWFNLIRAYANQVGRFLDSHALRIGLGFPTMAGWLFFIESSAKKGLFVNELPLIHTHLFGIRFMDLALVTCSIIIFLVLTLPRLHTKPYVAGISKFIFIFPLLIIGVQYLRQNVAENTYLPFWLKVSFLCLAVSLAFVGTKIKLSHVERYARNGRALFSKDSN
jgi:hypothetical protein